jgi:hypothetical protein
MKAITEFPSFVLSKGLAAKTALTTEGKSPEEVSAKLGETFKFEGDKLKHFIAAIDLSATAKDLKRIMVVGLAEGETAPAKAVKVEEHYYIPESLILSAPVKPAADAKGGRGGKGGGGRGGGKGGGGPKGSPWGMSPEELAAKNKPAAPKT